MHLLGGFEQAVLLAVLRLRADAYGRAILEDIRQKLGDGVTSGAVYVTLDRLEAKGLLASRSTANGRRYFAVLANGTRALEKTKQAFDRIWDGFE
jgi:DNA-binding PadR family transcriptional regulator